MKAYDKQFLENISPNEVLEILKNGNKRFVENKSIERNLLAQAHTTAIEGQFPIATFLSCIDARTSIEHIFDLGIGDAFNVKIAGNIINEDILGSLEYACKVAGSKIIVVKGHTKCGAVSSACKGVELGNITGLLQKIKTPIKNIENKGFSLKKDGEKFNDLVSKENVIKSVNDIRKGSSILKEMEKNKEIKIIGAFHFLKSGVVEFFEVN